MPGAIVQSGYAVDDSSGTATTIAATLTGVSAGNLLVAIVGFGDPTGAITCSVSDGTAYTADAAGKVRDTFNTQSSQVFYLPNAGAGSHTITATLSVAESYRRIRVFEISGVATASPEDKAAGQYLSNVGTTTDSISSGATATTTNANDFVLGLVQDTGSTDPGSGTLAAGTGYTLSGTNQIIGAEYKNVSSVGAQTATFTDTKNSNRTAHVLALKLAATGQVLAPVADVSDGAWTPSTGTDLYACVDETSYSDTDYIQATTATTCELDLANGSDPASSVDHKIDYRLLAGTGTVAVALKQGGTTIASFSADTLTGAAQTLQKTLSGAQADSITDYAGLSVTLTSAAPEPNITYVGGQVGGRAGSTSTSAVTFALTGGSNSTPQAGDLVIIGCTVASAGRTPACAISGYTEQTQINANGTTYDTSLNMSYKFMGGTPDTTFTLPSTGNVADAQRYTVQVWRGVDATTPLDVAAVSASGTATGRPNPGSITPTTSGAKVGIIGAGAAATGASYTAPANYTTGFLTGTTSDTNDAMIGSGYRSWTSGAEDPAQYTGGTINAADSWAAFTYALRPDSVISAKVSWIQFQTPEATGALAAAAAGSAQASGTAAPSVQVALAAAGVDTSGGTATAGAAIPLSAAGIATAGGTGNLTAVVTISAAGLAQAAGQAGLLVGVQLAAAGAAAATGNAALAGQIALAASGAAQASGSATLAAQLAAVAAGAAQASGSANLTGGPSGAISASGGAQASGTAILSAQVAILASGLAQAGGNATLAAQLAAIASGADTASGTATLAAQLAAAASGLAQAGGSGTLAVQLAAMAAGADNAGGSATLTAQLAAIASGLATAGGNATLGAQLAAVAAGSATAGGSAALVTLFAAAASGAAQASGSANLTGGAPGSIAAFGSAQAYGSATLSVSVAVAASGAAVAGGSASFTETVLLSAAGFVQAVGAGQLRVDVALSGVGHGEASGAATLTNLGIAVALPPGGPQMLRKTEGERPAMVGGRRPSHYHGSRPAMIAGRRPSNTSSGRRPR